MNESKHPFVYFAVFTVAVQAVMWLIFCLFDYGINEHHWVSEDIENDAENAISYAVLIVILLLPIVSYFLLNRKKFSSSKPIKDTLIQIPCWCAIAFVISCPIFQMVNYDKWIIAQTNTSFGNGLEYLYPPIIEGIFAVVLLVKLIAVSVMKLRSRRAK